MFFTSLINFKIDKTLIILLFSSFFFLLEEGWKGFRNSFNLNSNFIYKKLIFLKPLRRDFNPFSEWQGFQGLAQFYLELIKNWKIFSWILQNFFRISNLTLPLPPHPFPPSTKYLSFLLILFKGKVRFYKNILCN